MQFQTQWWIERFGFYLPAVLTVPGSRGEIANGLRLDLLVDDQLINCVEVVSASPAKAVLMLRSPNRGARDHAINRGIGVVQHARRGGHRAGAAERRAAAEARPDPAAGRLVLSPAGYADAAGKSPGGASDSRVPASSGERRIRAECERDDSARIVGEITKFYEANGFQKRSNEENEVQRSYESAVAALRAAGGHARRRIQTAQCVSGCLYPSPGVTSTGRP